MNALSVAHTIAQNQSKKSWNDDPFDLKGLVTGVQPVNHERNLYDYAMYLVPNYGKYDGYQYELSLDMLPDDEQNELVRLYIESIDREIEWACYGKDESINSDFLCALLSMLKDDNTSTRARFAETTRNNLIEYYAKSLDKFLDDSCSHYFYNEMTEAGYRCEQDLEHGDFVWK